MGFQWTMTLLLTGLVLCGVSLWQQRRPREIGALAFPATAGLAIGVVLVVLALGHLVSLETGQVFTGRLRY